MGLASLPPLGDGAAGDFTPTDLSQFIRLEQCQRYLRLRLTERAQGRGFLTGVTTSSLIPSRDRSASPPAAPSHRIAGPWVPFTGLTCAGRCGCEVAVFVRDGRRRPASRHDTDRRPTLAP
jgi:hypothetical protein